MGQTMKFCKQRRHHPLCSRTPNLCDNRKGQVQSSSSRTTLLRVFSALSLPRLLLFSSYPALAVVVSLRSALLCSALLCSLCSPLLYPPLLTSPHLTILLVSPRLSSSPPPFMPDVQFVPPGFGSSILGRDYRYHSNHGESKDEEDK
eukprot:758274-Hanusia_phi.AAC.3